MDDYTLYPEEEVDYIPVEDMAEQDAQESDPEEEFGRID